VMSINGTSKQEVCFFLKNKGHKLAYLLETKITLCKVHEVVWRICRDWQVQTNTIANMRSKIWLVWTSNYYKVNFVKVYEHIIHAYNLSSHELFIFLQLCN